MNLNYREKIKKSSIEESPYPHLIIDNILDASLVEEIKNLWPQKKLHNDERGSNCFYFSSELKNAQEDQKLFWQNLINIHMSEIANLLFAKMSNFVGYKKVSNKIEWGTAYTQENENNSSPLDFFPHTHFDHDPLWALTFLIYIEDINDNSPGTSICSLGDNKNERIDNFIKWNEIANDDSIEYLKKIELTKKFNIKHIKTVDFISNRLFCFIDGPFSFHSVNYKKSNFETNRKSLRFALGFERNKMNLKYNVEPEKWISLFKENNKEKIKKILNLEHDEFFSNDKSKMNNDWYIDKFPFF
tara:strand:+ start:441 stop:1343 length:903 start_codon:yes stop_codon:yes gene_type:complete